MNIIIPIMMWLVETRGAIFHYIKVRLDSYNNNAPQIIKAIKQRQMQEAIRHYSD